MNQFRNHLPLQRKVVNLGNAILLFLYFTFLLPLLGVAIVLECIRYVVYNACNGLLFLLQIISKPFYQYLDLWKK